MVRDPKHVMSAAAAYQSMENYEDDLVVIFHPLITGGGGGEGGVGGAMTGQVSSVYHPHTCTCIEAGCNHD